MRSVIGLCGPMRSGKDTIGSLLVEHHGYTRFAFADAVKECALALDPIIGIVPTDPEHKAQGPMLRLSDLVARQGVEAAKAHPEVRRLLQRLGTEMGREVIDPNLWVAIVAGRSADTERVVITDLRFPNEAEWVRSIEGGVVVRVYRAGTGGGTHASEALLESIDPDVGFVNGGSFGGLAAQVQTLVDTVEAFAR